MLPRRRTGAVQHREKQLRLLRHIGEGAVAVPKCCFMEISSSLDNQLLKHLYSPVQVSGYGERGAHMRDSDTLLRVTPAQIEESVNKSLARLGTDYIDLLQVPIMRDQTREPANPGSLTRDIASAMQRTNGRSFMLWRPAF